MLPRIRACHCWHVIKGINAFDLLEKKGGGGALRENLDLMAAELGEVGPVGESYSPGGVSAMGASAGRCGGGAVAGVCNGKESDMYMKLLPGGGIWENISNIKVW